jgi:hypothetical protein
MKLFLGLISTILPVYHAAAATVDWQNVSANERVCTKVNDGGNVCKTSVTLKCTFTDVNGVLRSCLAEDNKTPFFYVSSSQCGVVQATIEMKVCNLNTSPDHWIQPWTSSNNFLFEKQQILPNPDRFERLNPGQCRIVKTVKPLDTCVKTHPMSAEVEGNMPVLQGNSHCRCYLWRQSRVKIYSDATPAPSNLVNTCSNDGSVNTCDADVSISCEYSDGGQTKSCMSNGSDQPFIQLEEEQCQNIQATISMEMCNKNQLSFTPWTSSDNMGGYERYSFFKYSGSFYETPISSNIAPSNCVSWTSTQSLDTCSRKSWPMSVKFEGTLSNGDYCYCYLFHKTFAAVWAEPPLAELDNALIITEMLDGTNGSKFVELYAPDVRLRDGVITDDLYLCKMTANGPIWNSAIPLINTRVDSNGFIVLCNQADVYSGCKTVDDPVSIFTDTNYGCMDIAIVKGGALQYEIVDSYGIVGSGCDNGDASRFTGGRGERLPSFDSPENPWVKSHWTISSPAGIADANPGVWGADGGNGGGVIPSATIPIIITEVVDLSTGDPTAPKYIELYVNDPTLHGTDFTDSLNLVRIPSGGASPDFASMIPLNGFSIGDDGFIVLCNVVSENIWGTDCDETYDTSQGTLVTSNTLGCDDVAIVSGSSQDNYNILDIYGNPGEQCNAGSMSSFTNGKAERINTTSSRQPKKVWAKSDWIVKIGSNVGDCHPRAWSVAPEAVQIMITELTDPNGEPENRYIELYSPNKQNYEILENYWVVLKGTPDYSYPLKGTRIGSDGFLLLCRSRNFWSETQCDHELGPNSVADNDGCQVVIIYSSGDGTNFDPNDIVDVYGIGSACAGDFQGGIVERLESVNAPSPVFRSQEWVVTKPASKNQCTPRSKRISSGGGLPPAPAPAPTPTKMPSNKNKNKNKNKNTSPSGGIIDPAGNPPSASPVSGKGSKSPKSGKESSGKTTETSSLLTSQSNALEESSAAASLSTMFGALVAVIGGWLYLW